MKKIKGVFYETPCTNTQTNVVLVFQRIYHTNTTNSLLHREHLLQLTRDQGPYA